MNPTYEIEKEESQPMLQAIRAKLIESGYKCRKFTGSNDGFVAKCGENWARVWFNHRCSGKAWITWHFYCDPNDPLHQQGIDYLIESAIVNFGFMKNFEKGKTYTVVSGSVETKKLLCTHTGGNLAAFAVGTKTVLAKKWRMGNSEYSPEVVEFFDGDRRLRVFASC